MADERKPLKISMSSFDRDLPGNGADMDAISKDWNNFKESYPMAGLLASIAPVTGQITAVPEINDALQRKAYGEALLSALQLIPFGGYPKAVANVKKIPATLDAAEAARGLALSHPQDAAIYETLRNERVKDAYLYGAQGGVASANVGSIFANLYEWLNQRKK